MMPPRYFLACVVLSSALAAIPWGEIGAPSLRWTGVLLIGAGLILNVLGARQFEHRRIPIRPGSASGSLSTGGVFSMSRNLMYLGMVLALTGIGLALGSRPDRSDRATYLHHHLPYVAS